MPAGPNTWDKVDRPSSAWLTGTDQEIENFAEQSRRLLFRQHERVVRAFQSDAVEQSLKGNPRGCVFPVRFIAPGADLKPVHAPRLKGGANLPVTGGQFVPQLRMPRREELEFQHQDGPIRIGSQTGVVIAELPDPFPPF